MTNKETLANLPTKGKATDRLIWSISKTLRRYEYGREYFSETLKKTLETKSLLIYFNHFSLLDSGVVLKILDEEGLLDKVHVFVSQKHLDGKFQGFIIKAASRCKNFEVLPVVQNKQEDRNIYPKYQAINLDSFRKASRILKQPGNIVLITPEGTRSKNKELIQAEEGMASFFRLVKNSALAYPIAMRQVVIIPFVTKTRIAFGKSTLNYEGLTSEVGGEDSKIITRLMMEKLANLLPPINRGVYK